MSASNTFDTTNLGSAVSNTEDLQRASYLVSPENSPLYSTLDKVKASAVYHEWTVDDMDAPNDAGVVEGADVTATEDAFEQMARVGNYIQTVRRTAKVTNIQELVDNAAGVNFANAVMKKLKELNRDTEKALNSTNARSAGSKTTPRISAGFAEMLGGASGVFPAEYQTPAGSRKATVALSEGGVNDIIRSIFNESGELPSLRIYAGSAWTQAFSDATVRLASTPTNNKLNVNLDGTKGRITSRVRIYESQHGVVEVFDLNSKCANRTQLDMAFFINPKYAAIGELGTLRRIPLPDLGGGPRMGIERHFTAVVKNPRAHGYWRQLA